jgi:hypothetical protein
MLQDVNHPTAGLMKMLASPVLVHGERLPIRRPPPLLGQLTKEFSSSKSTQWNAFISRNSLAAPDLDNILTVIKLFGEPPFLAAQKGENFLQQWKAAAGWC